MQIFLDTADPENALVLEISVALSVYAGMFLLLDGVLMVIANAIRGMLHEPMKARSEQRPGGEAAKREATQTGRRRSRPPLEEDNSDEHDSNLNRCRQSD